MRSINPGLSGSLCPHLLALAYLPQQDLVFKCHLASLCFPVVLLWQKFTHRSVGTTTEIWGLNLPQRVTSSSMSLGSFSQDQSKLVFALSIAFLLACFFPACHFCHHCNVLNSLPSSLPSCFSPFVFLERCLFAQSIISCCLC